MAGRECPLDFDSVRFESLSERPSKVRLADLGRPAVAAGSFPDFLDSLPAVLAAQSLKQLRDAIVAAHAQGRPYWPRSGAM